MGGRGVRESLDQLERRMVLVRIIKDRGFWLTVALIDFVVAEHGWIATEAYRHKTEKK